ncbi:MAG: exocyst complex component Sec10-domain-containing protein [Monoraphidium minutum]|nr:MAG: exocyst complex component Sec10-domain-containing protein [Monoraphidium minutum]
MNDLDFALIDPSIFQNKRFSVDAFLVSLTKDVIGPGRSASQPAGKDALSANEQVLRVQRLLGVLERAEDEVGALHQHYAAQVSDLQELGAVDEAQYRADVSGLERCLERIKAGVRDVDARVSRVSQTATRIGDRLQTAEAMRVRCLEAQELIGYLQAFSTLPGADGLGRLPRIFTDDGTMAEAAAVSRRLSLLAGEVATAKARTKQRQGQQGPATPGSTGGIGSIEHAAKMLETYCSQLEHRVIERFDAAVDAGDEEEQAECVRIMIQCDKERSIAQRWVASRPMFLAIDDAMLEEVLIKALSALYKEMHASVKQEVATAKAIFPRPEMVRRRGCARLRAALDMFMQRLFEQEVQMALEKLLSTRALHPQDADGHQAKLRMLVDTYGKTVDVAAISDGLWPTFLANYPAQELAWLDAAYQLEAAKHDGPELSLQLALRMMELHREATARAQKLSVASQLPRNVRMLFHSLSQDGGGGGGGGGAGGGGARGGGGGAHPGCLLEQLARHIAGGVEYSLELCTAGGSGALAAIFRMGLGSINRASSGQMAQTFVNDRIRRVLVAAHQVAEITTAAQAHFEIIVLPAVSPSVADHGAASAALLALLRAAEESVTAVLRRAVDVFVSQLERVLYTEQRKSDFVPKDEALSFDRPTPACMLGTSMLSALGAAGRDTLDGPNLAAVLSEVGRRTHAVLVTHMGRYAYSPTGALKWKKDVAEYAEALRGYGVPAVDEEMAALEQLVNVLVVAPESLMGLVNGSLRMAHRDALRVIALREDFKTAKVDGRSLAQLFSGQVEGVMSMRV